jgi:hypothetical protein
MSLALIRLFLGAALKKLVAWLSHRSFWQIVSMGLALLLVVQTVRVKSEQRHAHKVETQLSKAVAELNSISSKRDDQKRETAERIKVVTQTIHDADERAKLVEKAPPAPNCRTKPEVMNADI